MGSDMCRTAKAGENDGGNEDRSRKIEKALVLTCIDPPSLADLR